jgi:hypothetical protein
MEVVDTENIYINNIINKQPNISGSLSIDDIVERILLSRMSRVFRINMEGEISIRFFSG